MSKKRKYSDEYISFGFTFMTERDGTQKPQCFLGGKVLANGSMKPSKLKDHLKSFHPNNLSDKIDQLRMKKARFEKAGTLPKLGFITTQKPFVEASYKVAYRIAKQKKTHTIGETLIKPCVLEMVEIVCGKKERKALESVPLSNDTIQSRITDISANILKQVMEELKTTPFPFSMQLDESSDISNCCQLLVFVRYVHADIIKEEFLFCESLPQHAKATDVLEMLNNFFANQNFEWKEKIGSLCTDGVPAMLGKTSGFATLVKKEAPQVSVTHCFLHRYALASKTLPENLRQVLSDSVKIVNLIRARALNHRIFKKLCQEMGAEHEVLLFHTEVRWLSRGQVLKRLFELRKEVSVFLKSKNLEYSNQFDNEEFLLSLAYLADIFSHLNEINISIQGFGVTVMEASEKIKGFHDKLYLWKRRLETENYSNFSMLEEMLLDNETGICQPLPISLRIDMCRHLEALQNSFKSYCLATEDLKKKSWILNPFLAELESISYDDFAKDELIELKAMESVRMSFNSKSIGDFWISLRQAYPLLVKNAMAAIIPFATTYLCESGFSSLVVIKTKSRNRLNVKDDMRVALSKTKPQFDVLIEDKQEHPSH